MPFADALIGVPTARALAGAIQAAAPHAELTALLPWAIRVPAILANPTATLPVAVHGPVLDAATVPFGGTIGFLVSIRNTGQEPTRLAVDYVMHHQKANGSLTGKTFKLTTVTLAPGERVQLNRSHSFRAITTRRYHPGAHAIEVQVNGVARGRADFTLLPED